MARRATTQIEGPDPEERWAEWNGSEARRGSPSPGIQVIDKRNRLEFKFQVDDVLNPMSVIKLNHMSSDRGVPVAARRRR